MLSYTCSHRPLTITLRIHRQHSHFKDGKCVLQGDKWLAQGITKRALSVIEIPPPRVSDAS